MSYDDSSGAECVCDTLDEQANVFYNVIAVLLLFIIIIIILISSPRFAGPALQLRYFTSWYSIFLRIPHHNVPASQRSNDNNNGNVLLFGYI